jgi:hypothetical protein
VLAAAFGVSATGCNKAGTRGETSAVETAGTATSTAGASTASANGACDLASIGLGRATSLSYRAPEGCRWKGAERVPIRSEEAFHTAFGCAAASGIDFAKNELRVETRTLSPATVGIDVVDDGAKITFVSRQRSPCPNEPPPMPIGVPVAYVAPAKSARPTSDAVCNVTLPCR